MRLRWGGSIRIGGPECKGRRTLVNRIASLISSPARSIRNNRSDLRSLLPKKSRLLNSLRASNGSRNPNIQPSQAFIQSKRKEATDSDREVIMLVQQHVRFAFPFPPLFHGPHGCMLERRNNEEEAKRSRRITVHRPTYKTTQHDTTQYISQGPRANSNVEGLWIDRQTSLERIRVVSSAPGLNPHTRPPSWLTQIYSVDKTNTHIYR